MSPSRERAARRRAVITSLSAVGAALSAAGEARAAIIVTNVNENIGFAAGDLPIETYPLPGGSAFTIHTGTGVNGTHAVQIVSLPGTPGSFMIKATSFNSFDRPVRANAGQTFNNVGGFAHNTVDIDAQTHSNKNQFTQGTFTNKYFMFEFNNAGTTDYGYMYGSETDSSYGGMTYDFKSYAYDNTGAVIKAGAGMVPEPSSAVLLGLGALATGAVGVRRWKAAKASSTTA